MKLVKIGILGCADIAERHILPAILNLNSKFKLITISSRSETKAKKISSSFGISYCVGYKNMIDNTDLDAVYIPLPNSLHYKWVLYCLKKNLHVLVEKSMCCTYEEVKKLNSIAKKKNLVLIENFQFRFHPQMKKIKEIIANDFIGEIRTVKSYFGFPPFKTLDNIRYNKALGGGSLYDAGAYPIKIAQIFLGQNIFITSSNLKYDSDLNVDIWGGAFIKKKDGPQFGLISFGFDNYYQCSLEIWGSKGKISAERIFTSPPNESASIFIETNNKKRHIKIEKANHFENIFEYFFLLIRGLEDPEKEYKGNINQSRLLLELKQKANNN